MSTEPREHDVALASLRVCYNSLLEEVKDLNGSMKDLFRLRVEREEARASREEARASGALLSTLTDRMKELVKGYVQPWSLLEAINELAAERDTANRQRDELANTIAHLDAVAANELALGHRFAWVLFLFGALVGATLGVLAASIPPGVLGGVF